ncbi:MAG: type I glutamate--ammonia ligase [Nitrospirae bacterium]|nr:type I glutamate--ammonia ligase [Nitrospirota bacterium]
MTPKEVLKFAKENGARACDVKFCDMLGKWQHFTTGMSEISEETFEEGLGFDGSSIRGWQGIQESDMLVMPDPKTAVMDPFCAEPTLTMICDILDPVTRKPYSRDPRYVAKKAIQYLKKSGIGDAAYFGPEPEFFIFDGVRYASGVQHSFYYIDSREGWWTSGSEEAPSNLGHKPRYKEGYFPVSPNDTQQDIRTEMLLTMEKVGIIVEKQHHEVATAGQAEIDMRFMDLVEMGDKLMWFKYIVKNVAAKAGKTVTFMPKPLYGDNGSGMHTHQSIWKGGKPLFAGEGYAGLSELGLSYIAGIMKHAYALCAIVAPTVNSYRRLVPGYEAPVNIAYSARNRSACCRIPLYSPSPKAKRVEVRFPDPACNPYLAFAAMLMAGLDGVEKKLKPGEPLDKNLYHLPPQEAKKVKQLPGSLPEALAALDADHDFLKKGDVFTDDLIEAWTSWKVENEIDPIRLKPTAMEFELYYDV